MQSRSRGIVRFVLSPLILLLAGCNWAPEGIEPVDGFELERYLGTWYEIARLDHSFERGLTDVTATYALDGEGGVTVLNRGWDAEKGEWKEAEGRAEFTGPSAVAQLKVVFFWPFWGGYNVIALDREHYGWAMVAGPDRSYLWLLSRRPTLAGAVTDSLLAQARELGFDTDELIFVTHDRAHGLFP